MLEFPNYFKLVFITNSIDSEEMPHVVASFLVSTILGFLVVIRVNGFIGLGPDWVRHFVGPDLGPN